MAIELAGLTLARIHQISTLEQADFVHHHIPGLDGNVAQDMGRNTVRLCVQGIFYGDEAPANIERLRDVYKAREPVDFLAEIVGQAYFAQVILEQFEVMQSAHEPDQFSYVLTLAEHVVLPEPEPLGGPDVDAGILAEAGNFMDMIQLPDLLSVPNFADPTIPLNSVLGGISNTLGPLTGTAQTLTELFGDAS